MDITVRYCSEEGRIPAALCRISNLNSIMPGDRWPLPRVDEILDDMRGSSVFTKIDIFQGYWQIKMDETCKEKAVFICRYGTFQLEVIPFSS